MKIEINNISKSFGNVDANKNISLKLSSGIHALLGENGAGKSTLVKIISGQILPDKGNILINDKEVILGSPRSSINVGIGLLNQDPLDFSNLSIFESFLIGISESNPYRKIVQIKSKIEKLFDNYNVKINLNRKTSSLSIGERQQVELLRLLYNGAKLIILDEPTSAFSLEQKKIMFDTLRKLSKEGIIIIFVSHKLDEVFEICDSASILRSGKLIENIKQPFDSKKILSIMFEKSEINSLAIKDFDREENFIINFSKKDLNLKSEISSSHKIKQGSIIGIAGLHGSSNDDYVKNFFTGEFSSTGIELENNLKLSKNEIYYMPADRLEKGLFSDMTLIEHFGLSETVKKRIINWNFVKEKATNKIQEFDIRANLDSQINELSGGNQQRVMLSLMPSEKSFLLLEQPTRGLDINSANKIWEMILERKEKDYGVFFSSTDIDEIWDYSDIIISVSGDQIMNIDTKNNLQKDRIAKYISGII